MNIKSLLSKEIKEALLKDSKVIAVLLFGSFARNEKNYRDIDICLVLDKKYPPLQLSKKKLQYAILAKTPLDIQIFQQLPIYIRKRILKEGKVLICKNQPLLYEIAFSTIKEFGFYEKLYNLYLDEIEKNA